jgi:hypothetical protein
MKNMTRDTSMHMCTRRCKIFIKLFSKFGCCSCGLKGKKKKREKKKEKKKEREDETRVGEDTTKQPTKK